MRTSGAKKRGRTATGTRRHLVVLLLIVLAFSSLPVQPALADPYARPRDGGPRLWAPQEGVFGTRPAMDSMVLSYQFKWNHDSNMEELRGSHRALELKSNVSCDFANGYEGYQFNNFPSGSRPYRDTRVFDTGSVCKFGFGAANANFFTANNSWLAEVQVQRPSPTANPASFPIAVTVVASSNLEHYSACTSDALCTFPDYSQYVVDGNAAITQTGTHQIPWTVSLSQNGSFQNGTTGFTVDPGNTSEVRCSGGFRSTCYLRVGNTAPGGESAVHQQLQAPPYAKLVDTEIGHRRWYTGQTAVKCPASVAQCAVWLTVEGEGGSGTDELRSVQTQIDSGSWYLCRIDSNSSNVPAFERAHDTARFTVHSGHDTTVSSLDVDSMELLFYHTIISGTSGDPGPPPPTSPTCVPRPNLEEPC